MTDPVTFTVGSIAALAFAKLLETSAGEAAKKLTPAILNKMDALRKKIWTKLRGISDVDKLNATVEKDGKITDQHIRELLTPHLEAVMKADTAFANEIRQLASEINQEINISEVLGKNIQNVYGGSPVQINDPKAPVFTGEIRDSTINISITN